MTDLTFEDVQQAREELQDRRHRFLFAWAGFMPVVGLVFFVVSTLILVPLGAPQELVTICFFGLALAWMLFLFYPAGRSLTTFVCPKCQQRFGTAFSNLLQQRCQCCGLALRPRRA